MTTSRSQTLRDLIEDDDLDGAAKLLRELAREQGGDLPGRAINVKARLAQLRRDLADGSLTRQDGAAERARIRLAFLSLLEDVERAARPRPPPDGAPVDFLVIAALEGEREAVLAKLPGARKLDRDGADVHTYFEAAVRTSREDGASYRIIPVRASSRRPALQLGEPRARPWPAPEQA